MNKLPKCRSNNLVVQETESELLVYDLEINKAFCLNQTSAIVYQLCNGQNSVSEISRLLSRALQQPVSEEMIWLALDSLKKENLLEKADEFEIDFRGLNRRQVIKKVGLASMVMLPLISSVIAPSAVNAASKFGLRSACASNSECLSNNCSTCLGLFGNMQCCLSGSSSSAYCGDFFNCIPQGNCTPSSCCSGQAIFSGNPTLCGAGRGYCLCPND